MDDHYHCAECQSVIPLFAIDKAGNRIELEVEAGTQFRVLPEGGQLKVLQIPVPLCNACADKIKKQSMIAPPRLIVPKQ